MLARLLKISALFFVVASCAPTSMVVKPFSTDGCSMFPEGTLQHKNLWLRCCVTHDLAYWQGGSYGQRQQADETLRACVSEVGEPEIALLMLSGVRVGGSPYWPTQFRWAYGWPYTRGYEPLSEGDRKLVGEVLQRQGIDPAKPWEALF